MQLVWLVPHLQHPGLAEACDAEVARLEAVARRGAAAGSLLCVRVEKGAASLPQRMALLAAKAAGELLLLCPRAVLEFAEVEPEEEAGVEEEGAEGGGAAVEGGGGAARRHEADAYRHHEALRGAWDRQMRQAFSGSEDVRRHVKDRLLLVQAGPRDQTLPVAHALLHRTAIEQLGYVAPPVGNDWLLASLWLQQIFAGHGRYRALTRLRLREVRGAPLVPPAPPPPGSPHAGLRARFERGVATRAMDAARLLQGLRVLQPKVRTSFSEATAAYTSFAAAFNRNRLADSWPLLAELHWGLMMVQQSEDWQLRDHIDPAMIDAVHDLQRRCLDAIAQAPTLTLTPTPTLTLTLTLIPTPTLPNPNLNSSPNPNPSLDAIVQVDIVQVDAQMSAPPSS